MLPQLHNAYFVLRHGKSLANEQKIIVSNPGEGVSGYGLSEEGKREVQKSAEEAKAQGTLDDSTIIYSSDFARAKESAEIAGRVLRAGDVTFTSSLRERFFGAWDKTHNSNYERVWEDDSIDHTHTKNGVESVESVVTRVTSLITHIESAHTNKNILLVSHGDTLQILQTVFDDVHPKKHRTLHHLKTGEIRSMITKGL